LPLALMPARVAPQRKPAGTFAAFVCGAASGCSASTEAAPETVLLIIRLLYQARMQTGRGVLQEIAAFTVA
jgi:hypothetical protein